MAFPVIRGTSAPLYPFKRTLSCSTRVQDFENGTQQRYALRKPLVNFDLPYSKLLAANVTTLAAEHASDMGMSNAGLSLVLGTVTYTNLGLLDDEFYATESVTTQYSSRFRLRQTIPQTLASDANGGVYPDIVCQLPYTRKFRSRTYVNEQPSGKRYAYGLYGTGLTGFPTRELAAFEIGYEMLSDADLITLEKFFVAMNGRMGSFSFTDYEPPHTVYTTCHFASDDLDLEYIQPDVTKVRVAIEESAN